MENENRFLPDYNAKTHSNDDASVTEDHCCADETVTENKRLIDFLEKKKGIDIQIIKYFIGKGLLYQEKDAIIAVGYDKKRVIYKDYGRKTQERDNAIPLEKLSFLLIGRNKTSINIVSSLVEAMSYLSLVLTKHLDYKEFTIMVLNDYKLIEYYAKEVSSIKRINVIGDYGRNENIDKLEENLKKNVKISFVPTVKNSINEDLQALKKTE